ncbi:nitrate reductase subunit gamma [Geomonas limicola]|uniref:Nitrate reductase subunit gamma n=1 Tax=Geomonas limicola TaxID=2740186 RepID=A0A6V8N2E2_9BACT|nr:respiratory nitrate reductase subunit gamma [Geomonas limicola]GFO66698.1 nitrate reductase subunit gamma [Geomonas limicola]
MLNTLIFVALPYVALALLFGVSISRYLTNRLTWSAYSTELLERNLLYWGSNPWHYGIIPLLFAHLIPVIFATAVALLLGNQATLLILEGIALGLGLLALLGILLLLLRRVNSSILKRATYFSDWLILILLLVQTGTGVYMSAFLRWGSLWYLHAAVPYFRSIWYCNPQVEYLADFPPVVKLHVACAMVILAVLPFTKLVHLLYLPIDFLKDAPILYRWRGGRVAKREF